MREAAAMELSDIKKSLSSKSCETIIGEEDALKASVLIPLVQTEEGLAVLFEERSHQLKSQPGDICFPGGRMDQRDQSPVSTAIRETSEELGIKAESIEVLGALGRYIPSMQLIIYPFVGYLKDTDFAVNPAEVASTFQVPLLFLLNAEPEKFIVHLEPQPEDDFPYDRIARGKAYAWRKRQITELFYRYQNRHIWGMTAKILNHFLTVIRAEKG